jgi:hypothetical protein
MAKPILKPEPDIPINCSAEILEAIKEAPIAHHFRILDSRFLFVIDVKAVSRYYNEVYKEYNII